MPKVKKTLHRRQKQDSEREGNTGRILENSLRFTLCPSTYSITTACLYVCANCMRPSFLSSLFSACHVSFVVTVIYVSLPKTAIQIGWPQMLNHIDIGLVAPSYPLIVSGWHISGNLPASFLHSSPIVGAYSVVAMNG
jgi:hypothetical protein